MLSAFIGVLVLLLLYGMVIYHQFIYILSVRLMFSDYKKIGMVPVCL